MKMNKFKGFDEWVQIFMGGKQIDSEGVEHDGDALVDAAVQKFSAAHHEPPLVFGHPKDDSPAYGWVEELRAEESGKGKVLLARFKDVADGVEDLIKAGRYKKRSAAFYPDGSLRHVGFLGAVPPAVKGLEDLKFNDGEPTTFEFYDYKTSLIARILGKFREYLIEKEGLEKADQVIDSWEVDSLKEEANRDEPVEALFSQSTDEEKEESAMGDSKTEKTFTQADLDAAREEAKEKGKQAAQATFAEQQKQKTRGDALARIKEFCEKAMKDGGPPPALLDAGLQQFLEGLDCHSVIEFSEEKKATGLDWFLENFEKVVSPQFGEHANSEDIPDMDDANEIARLAIQFQEAEAEAGRTISMTEAVNHVTKKKS